jgi:hypothetical protein
MKSLLLLIALLLGGILLPALEVAAADDIRPWVVGPSLVKPPVVKPWRYNDHGAELPFPRGERAQSVWALGACWSECGSYCAWGLASCLTRNAQGHCLNLGDKCDRYCQRSCRSNAGPLVPIEFVWD